MFVAKIKNMLAVVLAIELVLAGIGAGLIGQTQASEPPHAKDEQSDKTDQERMVGNWHIINDDSARKGEMWVISEDRILMYAKHGGANGHLYSHRLDAGKDPKQIDIKVTLTNGKPIGIIKGLYALDGDELRLCLAALDKDRPAAFPKKPGPGEVLILQRATSGASPPKAKEIDPAGKTEQKVLTPAEAIKQRSKEKVTVQFKVAAVQDESRSPGGGFGQGFILLKDDSRFSVRLVPPAMDTLMRLDIEPVKHFSGKVVRVTGLVQPDHTGSSFHIRVDDLNQSQFTFVKE
jgi:uncharacterized protein (TIGR03067 family)